MGKEIATQVQKIEESPKQEKSKVKHPKTILIKLMKIKPQRTNITSSMEPEMLPLHWFSCEDVSQPPGSEGGRQPSVIWLCTSTQREVL